MNADQVQYYAERAKEYEKIYDKPERTQDLEALKKILKESFNNKSVFEVACGTGYWTQFISESAKSITSTDINDAVIQIAKAKKYGCPINFQKADIFQLPPKTNEYDGLFGGFIWSHVLKQNIVDFVKKVVHNIDDGGLAVFIDNQYVLGSSTPIHSTDDFGNTYQMRTLADGSLHIVIKNFPTDEDIIAAIGCNGKEFEITRLKYYWVLKFKVVK